MLPAFLVVLVVAAALVVFAVRSKNRRWKTLLGLAAPLVILASCVGLFQIDHYHAPLVNVAAPASASLSLILADPQTIYSLRARDGTVRWRHPFQGVLEPLAADNVVYVAEGKTEYTANALDALAASDGHLLWHTSLASLVPGAPPQVISGRPLLLDELLYVTANDETGGQAISSIYVLRASNGSLAWSMQVNRANVALNFTWLAAGNGLFFVGSNSGSIRAFHATDGSPAWTWQGADTTSNGAVPYYADGTVYAALSRGGLIALRASDGAVLWSSALYLDFPTPTLSIADGHLYFASTLDNTGTFGEYLYALDAQDGHLLWKYQILNPDGATASEVDGVVYYASNLYLDALRASDGHRLWRHASNANVGFGTPLVLDGAIFVKTGVIYPRIFTACPDDCEPPEAIDALNPRDGSVYWRYAAPLASLQAPPGVVSGQA